MQLVLEAQGLGYQCLISYETYHALVGQSEARVYTYLQMMNEQFLLIGFATKPEREFYRKLIQVPGIGPKLAIRVLSQVSFKNLQRWVIEGDEKSISGISGIGKKTASKIILELTDKLVLSDKNEGGAPIVSSYVEASDALEGLGFQPARIKQVLQSIQVGKENLSLEDIIKRALQLLGR